VTSQWVAGAVASGPQVQVEPAALELELVDLALAVILAAGLGIPRQLLQLGQQFSYVMLSVATQHTARTT
jgi:hypothetical protein